MLGFRDLGLGLIYGPVALHSPLSALPVFRASGSLETLRYTSFYPVPELLLTVDSPNPRP